MGEVMQADHGANPTLHQTVEHFPVAPQRRKVPFAFVWFNAAPIHRKTHGIEAHVARQVEIAFSVVPPVARTSTRIARTDAPGSFPIRPLILAVALHLVGSGRYAPEETLAELHGSKSVW